MCQQKWLLSFLCVLYLTQNVQGGCHKIAIYGASNAARNGIYTMTESHCVHDDRYIYAQDLDSNYLSYSNGYWIISTNSYCRAPRNGIATVLDKSIYPEEITGLWNEKGWLGNWESNTDLHVVCHEKNPPGRSFARRTVDGIAMGSVIFLLALTGSMVSWIRARRRRQLQRVLLESEMLNMPTPDEETLRRPFQRLFSSRTNTSVHQPAQYSDLESDPEENLSNPDISPQGLSQPPTYDASTESLDNAVNVTMVSPPSYEEAVGYSGIIDPPKHEKSEPPPYTPKPDDDET